MSRTMQTIQEDIDAIVPYSMHVSSRYLDLTKQKLDLTRLPKENDDLSTDEQWDLGVPKSVLEPLLDHWLEDYDWRASEANFNATLPQFRTLISLPPVAGKDRSPIRTHFVHTRSPHTSAVPLLYIHSWPGSFIEAARIIPLLTNPFPSSASHTEQQAFHVVCPSIPGFGFSDPSTDPSFGIAGAAEVFASLMRHLGYESYIIVAGGLGYEVARHLARNDKGVRGVFTWNPTSRPPTMRRHFAAWVKWHIARLTGARWLALGFGYTPDEIRNHRAQRQTIAMRGRSESRVAGTTLHQLLATRPQTLAFSLADSPVGLLALLLDLLPQQRLNAGLARPRSPFLDPDELEMQDRVNGSESARAQDVEAAGAGHERVRSDDTVKGYANGHVDASAALARKGWSPTDVLDWVMMMWLPGAESGLRWLRRAYIENSESTDHHSPQTSTLSHARSPVPLGIATFRSQTPSSPLMWGRADWEIGWVRRRKVEAEMPAWEVPGLLVGDVRDWVGEVLHRKMEEVV